MTRLNERVGFSGDSVVNNPPAKAGEFNRRVQSLRQEDPLEEEMASPLQYSCLGNPMARGACPREFMGSQKNQT